MNMEKKLVTVDYSLSLEEMIRAGKYFHVNLTPSEISQPKPQSKTVQQVNIEFVEFNQNCEMQTMLNKFDNDGLRPASLPEFLALGAQYPKLQEEFVITTLAAVEKRNFVNFKMVMEMGEDRLIPCLTTADNKRLLFWAAFDGEYRPGFLFACVRKNTA